MFALALMLGGPAMWLIAVLCAFAVVAGMARVSTGYVGDPVARTYQATTAGMGRGFAVVQGSDDYHVAIAGAGQLCIGLILESTINIGDTIAIAVGGETVGVIGAAVTAGELLTTDAQGRLVPATPGTYVIAKALSSNSNVNDEVTVQVLTCGPGSGLLGATYATVAGAIAVVPGFIGIDGAGALAMTLATPTTPGQDTVNLKIVALTAHAHTVSTAANKIQDDNATYDTVTFAHVGDFVELESINGVWQVVALRGATLSEV